MIRMIRTFCVFALAMAALTSTIHAALPIAVGPAGDVSGDGAVNVQDVVVLVGSVLDGSATLAGDLNCDEKTNVLDVVVLVDFILGDTILPVCGGTGEGCCVTFGYGAMMIPCCHSFEPATEEECPSMGWIGGAQEYFDGSCEEAEAAY